MSRSYIRKILDSWQSWRFHRVMVRTCPEYSRLQEQRKARRRQHGSVRDLDRQLTNELHAELAREVGRV